MAKDVIPTPDPAQMRFARGALERIRRRRLREYEAMMVTGFSRTCPVCGYVGEFAPVGEPPRLDGLCPLCRSRERHRLFKLWIDRRGRIGKDMAVLHFAPEPVFEPILHRLAGRYVTADFMRAKVDLKLNIEALELEDASFDLIIAHQILEHVDHVKALAECFRCLTPGGRLVVTTPVIEAWETTYVNPAVTTARGRLLHFGQKDHSRYFGRDLKDHMRGAGFALHEFISVEPDVSTYALMRGETLYELTKPAAERPTQLKTKTRKG
ncbi:methyltransferase domain-containing protein [Tabrizicola sp.]|uniref:methyltransferase domain-containing protein n=1 Tax=Tabrizicola sp. TaxID=2005166 RepID=UPI002FDD98CC